MTDWNHSEAKHQEALQAIAMLERHITALETLTGHDDEIAACKKMIDRLKELLTPPNGKFAPGIVSINRWFWKGQDGGLAPNNRITVR